MNTQTVEKNTVTRNFFAQMPSAAVACPMMQASSTDFGFDFNEQELAQELTAEIPNSLTHRTNKETEPEDVECKYPWFYL